MLVERQHRVDRRQPGPQHDGRVVRADDVGGERAPRVRDEACPGAAPAHRGRVRRRAVAHRQDDGVGRQRRLPRQVHHPAARRVSGHAPDLVEDHIEFDRVARRLGGLQQRPRGRIPRTTGAVDNRSAVRHADGGRPSGRSRQGDPARRCMRPAGTLSRWTGSRVLYATPSPIAPRRSTRTTLMFRPASCAVAGPAPPPWCR